MSAILVRVRAELRGRWRAWFGLALLLGLFGGAIIAAAAGARRTDSAYPRFLETQNAFTIGVPLGFFDPCCVAFTFDQVKTLPRIEEILPVTYFGFGAVDSIAASPDPRFGTTFNTFKVLEGRLPDPGAADEVIAPFELARQRRWRVGTVLEIQLPVASGGTEPANIRIVGFGAAPGDFPPFLGNTPGLTASPAFHARYRPLAQQGQNAFAAALIRLENGDADLDAFHEELDRLGGGKPLAFTSDQRDSTRNVVRSFGLQANALWLVAGLAAVSALLVFSQTLSREMFLESTENPILRSLGMTEKDLVWIGMARALIVAGAAAAIAAVVAVGLSPLFPTGLPRVAEPHPGVAFDATAIGAGIAAILILVCLLAAIPARRIARTSGAMLGVAETSSARSSVAVAAMARAGFSPAAVAGVRLALEPGRGRTAVPVRSTIAGITLGIAALATALGFSASLTHLLRTPDLYGQNWDATFSSFSLRSDATEQVLVPTLRDDPRVEALGSGTAGLAIEVDRQRVGAIVVDDVEGKVTPVARRGRSPRGEREILLGERTLRKLGKTIGDAVAVSVQGAEQAPMTIVGTGIIPPVGPTTQFGEGAAFRYRALERLCQCDVPPPDTVFARFGPGVPREATINELRRDLRQKIREEGFDITRPEKPTDLVNFGRVQSMPLILAGLLGALAAAVLTHALVTVIRRRRRDLAILKTLGFQRGQVRRTVAWQATTLIAISLAVGLPLGVVVGRWLWIQFADQLGIIPAPRVPVPAVLLAIPAGLLLANLIAARPARNAARTRPALVLRTE